MSHDLGTIGTGIRGETLNVAAFYGGKVRGPCVQFTIDPPFGCLFTQLTRPDVEALMAVLDLWLADHRP